MPRVSPFRSPVNWPAPRSVISVADDLIGSLARELTDEVRFHFSHLTEKFLVPLNRYFGSLIPTDLSVLAY